MRCYTKQHKASCGVELHARTLSLCILHPSGAILFHRTRKTRPGMCLQALAPSRSALGVAVACLFPWHWRADLCAPEQIPCVLGHALSMTALHGGQATTDQSDAQKITGLLRGARLSQA